MDISIDRKDDGPAKATILSSVQELLSQSQQVLAAPHATHPFASAPGETMALLNRIIEQTDQVSHALAASLSMPLTNPKLLSLYRQHATMSNALHTVTLLYYLCFNIATERLCTQSERDVKKTMETLRKRAGITYGEDIPLDRTTIVDWAVTRIEAWGASAGMETFKEEERDGRMTVVLGGKVLVVDVDLAIDRADPDKPVVSVAAVKTSYAIPNVATSSTTQGSASLDGFLADRVRAFLAEVQKEPREQDSVEAARLGTLCSESLKYLMRLDKLALDEGEGGLRWFSDIDGLAQETERFAVSECQAITS